MTMRQSEKADRFLDLHRGPGAFVIANVFDAGSARVVAGLGFEAVATSSGAYAGTLGRRDGRVTRAEALAHGAAVSAAVDLPVSADLENGFGPAPEDVAATVSGAAAAGLVGCTIEDASGDRESPVYEFEHAVARIAAGVAAARATGFRFALTGRCENFLRGRPDLADTIRRLQAYEAAGVEVLMAPGLPDLDAVRAVCDALDKPFSFMVGIPGKSFGVAGLEAAGVRRISLATSLWRAAMDGMIRAATEVRERGTFGYVDTAIPSPELAKYMAG